MSLPNDASDAGIVLYLVGSVTSESYTDRMGSTITAETLGSGYASMAASAATATSIVIAGLPTAHSIFALIHLSGATGIELKLQGQYGNDTDIDANWADIVTVREDSGLTANSHNLTVNGTYVLQTASAHTCKKVRVVAKANGGGPFVGADYVKAAMRAL